VIRYGAACPERPDEVLARRDDSRVVACVARGSFENATRPVEQLRDDRLLFARPDEVERVVLHGASGEVTAQRTGEGWRLTGATGEVDADSVQAWLEALAGLRVESREPVAQASARGLAPPSAWIEVSRTGVEGRERVELGATDADHAYARREGEPSVLALSASSADVLLADASRFRGRGVVRDVPEELRALVTEGSDFRDEVTRSGGEWSLLHPYAGPADAIVMRSVAERIASLDAQRWVSLAPRPEHGLDRPRARVVARFEGEGAPSAADAGADGGVARVREYTLAIGANAPAGGSFARLLGRDGVFVLAQSVLDELLQPHADHTVLSFERDSVQRIECEGRGRPRFAVRREASGWRTDAGAPYDRTRIEALLDATSSVRAPRVFRYGPAPTAAGLGEFTITFTIATGDAAVQTRRIQLGSEFAGSPSGVYARVDGVDATTSVPEEVSRAIRGCGQ
jgi:hypothetical protein